ncbi:hypothetical protein VTI74DRAFT_6790 [Chaetomium olivicolor]
MRGLSSTSCAACRVNVVTLLNFSMMFHPVSFTNFINGSIPPSLSPGVPNPLDRPGTPPPTAGPAPLPTTVRTLVPFPPNARLSSSLGSTRYTFGSATLLSTTTYLLNHLSTSSPPQNISPPSPNGSNRSLALRLFCRMVLWHSLSWKNSGGKLSPARELMMTLPYHHPTLGGRMTRLKTAETGTAKA